MPYDGHTATIITGANNTPQGYRDAKEGDIEPRYNPSKAAAEGLFKKDDTSKNRLDLIEPKFIEGLGSILTFGANKYEAHNWKKGNNDTDRLKGALLRHLMKYLDGDKLDEETGLSHLYHATCNLMFLDYFDRKKESK